MSFCPSCSHKVPGAAAVCPFCESNLHAGSMRGTALPAKPGVGAAIVLKNLARFGGGLLICGGIAMALIWPAFEASRLSARGPSPSHIKLRTIGHALHNYLDSHARFPPGSTVDDTGRAYHSWQAIILPEMPQTLLDYRIDYQKPWDDPANASSMMMAVPAYINPRVTQTSLPSGYGISHYAGSSHVLSANSSSSDRNVADGLSHTILAGEVAERFKAWGDPTNVSDPGLGINISPNGFGSPSPDGAYVLMMDGVVRFISNDIDPAVLKALATPNGGEETNYDDF